MANATTTTQVILVVSLFEGSYSDAYQRHNQRVMPSMAEAVAAGKRWAKRRHLGYETCFRVLSFAGEQLHHSWHAGWELDRLIQEALQSGRVKKPVR